MKITDWRQFYESLVIRTFGNPLPLPTVDHLDRFERNSGIRLPHSYREFLLVFGSGAFGGGLLISSPDHPRAPVREWVDLLSANKGYQPTQDQLSRMSPAVRQLASRMFYFAVDTVTHCHFGWNLDDIRTADGFEYGVYIKDTCAIDLYAASFKEFVEKFCEEIFSPNPNWIEEDCGPQRSFYPTTDL